MPIFFSYTAGNCCHGFPISIGRILRGGLAGEYRTSHIGSKPPSFDDRGEENAAGEVVRGRSSIHFF